jgi:sugar/nucleoside kinase (ribokinase family)
MKTGIFVGLVTLDMIYHTPTPLAPNEKRVADGVLLSAGGPATNAAIAFRALGLPAIIVGALGCHPLSSVIRTDLTQRGVELWDLTPTDAMPPSFSSIMVATETGDRTVIAANAVGRTIPRQRLVTDLWESAGMLLVDGHQMALSEAVVEQARQSGLPVVVDAGSWKPGFERVLPWATAVIASQNFRPPGCASVEAAIAYLTSLAIPHIAVTRGAQSILYRSEHQQGEVPVPIVRAIDTLGAGDIFHGAFCHYYPTLDFPTALHKAAQVAAFSCQFAGTRQWLHHAFPDKPL